MTSSNGNIFRVTDPLCGEFTGHRWITLTKASIAELWCFLWSAPWINGWVNNREAGDLRRHRAHHDVIILVSPASCVRVFQHYSLSSQGVSNTVLWCGLCYKPKQSIDQSVSRTRRWFKTPRHSCDTPFYDMHWAGIGPALLIEVWWRWNGSLNWVIMGSVYGSCETGILTVKRQLVK